MTNLVALAAAIQTHEGYYPMSRSWRNANPGNLRRSPLQAGQRGGFAYFRNYAIGTLALHWDLEQKCRGNTFTGLTPNHTLKDLIYKWAPEADGNNPSQYSEWVAAFLGIPQTTKLSWFLKSAEIKK